MATLGGNNSVQDGLLFHYDTGNTRKSFKGEPTVNLHPNPGSPSFAAAGGMVIESTSEIKPFNPTGIAKKIIGSSYVAENITGVLDSQYVQSWILKKCNHNIVYLQWAGSHNGNKNMYKFDFDNGTLTPTSLITGENAWATQLKDGWWQISSSSTMLNGTTVYGQITPTGSVYFGGIQFEQKDHPTPFTSDTRSTTESLYDLTGSNIINVTTATFNGDGDLTYDGAGYIDTGVIRPSPSTEPTTLEVVMTLPEFNPNLGIIGASNYNNSGIGFGCNSTYVRAFYNANGTPGETTFTDDPSGTNHYIIVFEGRDITVYKNGVSLGTITKPNDADPNPVSMWVGHNRQGGWNRFQGDIHVAKIYNVAITAQQARRNFRSYKSRFNLN
jgi:hypothetical protein